MEEIIFAFAILTLLSLIFYQKREFDKLKAYFEKHEHSKKMRDVIVVE